VLFAVAVFPPLVLAYTAFVYRVLRGRVTMAAVSFSILNAMWLEEKELDTGERAGAASEDGRAGHG
jgi:predicted outer membrane lipoprotein